ncbi:unnamed protein product, partial [Gulo gulo]
MTISLIWGTTGNCVSHTVLTSEYVLSVENCFAKEQLRGRWQSILALRTLSYFPSTSHILAGFSCSVWGQRKRQARRIIADFHVSFKYTISVFDGREN